MADLLKLAERCEAATGPDRGLDGWIHAHMTRGERYIIGSEPGRFPQKPIYGERLDVMRQLTADPDGAAQYIGAPAYTASLDAAMTLVPEGADYAIERVANEHWCSVDGPNGTRLPCRGGATPALALCAAALRARAGEQS